MLKSQYQFYSSFTVADVHWGLKAKISSVVQLTSHLSNGNQNW